MLRSSVFPQASSEHKREELLGVALEGLVKQLCFSRGIIWLNVRSNLLVDRDHKLPLVLEAGEEANRQVFVVGDPRTQAVHLRELVFDTLQVLELSVRQLAMPVFEQTG